MKHRRHAIFLTLMILVLISEPIPAASAQLTDTVVLTIDPAASSVVLGENLDVFVSVTNNGVSTSPPLVIHIDITKPDQATSVDPEDWTPTLSQTIGEVAPGETIVVDWTIQPISAGRFVSYAVALAPGVDNIAASNVLQVSVTDQRSLNPGGILPVAIAAPTLIGALLIVQMRLARRNRRTTRPETSWIRA